MSSETAITRASRVRASEAAIKAALRAIRGTGISVEKVCVTGGQIEIHCGQVEDMEPAEKDDGLEKW